MCFFGLLFFVTLPQEIKRAHQVLFVLPVIFIYLSEHKSPQNITMGSSFSSTSNADPSVPGENSTAAYPPLINDGPTIAEVTNVINVIMSCVDDDRLGEMGY